MCPLLIFILRKVDDWRRIIESLTQILEELIRHHQASENNSLFSKDSSYDNAVLRMAKSIDRPVFFEKAIGFAHDPSFRLIMKVVTSFLSSYHEFFFADATSTISSYLRFPVSFTRNMLSPRRRARGFLHMSENSSIDFFKVS